MSNVRIPTTIDVNQLISWENSKELVLQPLYQRNKVWNDSAKSYLIDSIMRDYPIPPIFLRDKLNLQERKTIREVVDGQQRITAILDFYNNRIQISKSQNTELGGKFFKDLDEESQEKFLTYKIIAEKITEKDDALIFDMFARLNSNSIPLNKQELRNARYTGEFKVAAYDLAKSFRDTFAKYKIFTTSQLSRMLDVEFISVLMIEYDKGIIDINGLAIDKYYQANNEHYNLLNEVKNYLFDMLNKINLILPSIESRKSKFFSPVYLYDLINVLKNQQEKGVEFNAAQIAYKINLLDTAYENLTEIDEENSTFIKLNQYKLEHQRHSTNKINKNNRIKFLEGLLNDRR